MSIINGFDYEYNFTQPEKVMSCFDEYAMAEPLFGDPATSATK